MRTIFAIALALLALCGTARAQMSVTIPIGPDGYETFGPDGSTVVQTGPEGYTAYGPDGMTVGLPNGQAYGPPIDPPPPPQQDCVLYNCGN